MRNRQKYLGNTGMLLMLAFLSAFPPLSTDIYLPALPEMCVVLHTTQAMTNLSLSLFFVFYACGILVWGPLSDKYGRKPILFCGLVIYILACLGCASADTVQWLIAGRILQAIGSSAVTAVATALVKDTYDGTERARVLAIVMSLVIIAPIVAPLIGAGMLKYASWRAIFLILAVIGCVAIMLTFLLQETVAEPFEQSFLYALSRPIAILSNRSLSILLALFSSTMLTLMAYLASASYIYIRRFGLNEQVFSLFFAFNAFCAMFGPMIYLRMSKRVSTGFIVAVCFAGVFLGGICVMTFGNLSQYMFAGGVALVTVSSTIMRPPGANLILEQLEGDTGSVSSLINFSAMVVGSLGMFLISLDWADQIQVLGAVQILAGFAGFCAWLFVRNKPYIIYGDMK